MTLSRSLSQKWVGTPFTASSLDLGPWSPGVPSPLEMYNCGPPLSAAQGLETTLLPAPADLVETDGTPAPESEPGSWGPAPCAGSASSSAYSQEGDRPYGLVSIDTVTVVGAEEPCAWPCTCGEDGYPALNLDAGLEPGPGTEDPLLGPGATVLSCGCVAAGGPAGLGGPLGSLLDKLMLPLEDEAGWAPGPPWGGGPPRGVSDREAGSPPAGLDMDTFDSGFAGSDCGSPVECDFTSSRDEGPPQELPPPVGGHGPSACGAGAPGQLARLGLFRTGRAPGARHGRLGCGGKRLAAFRSPGALSLEVMLCVSLRGARCEQHARTRVPTAAGSLPAGHMGWPLGHIRESGPVLPTGLLGPGHCL